MPTKDINDACKAIRDNWETITNEFIRRNSGKYLVLTCVHRSPTEQMELFKKGRIKGADGKWYIHDKAKIVTNVDGSTVLGAHNYKPSRAIDVAVVDNQTGKFLWEEKHYLCLGPIAKAVGLEWGGYWKTIKDLPHIQVPNYKEYKDA